MPETLHLPAWLWLAVVSPIALIVLTHLHPHSVTVLERAFNRRYHQARAQLTEAGRTGRPSQAVDVEEAGKEFFPTLVAQLFAPS